LEFLIDSFTLIARYGPVRRDPRPGIGAADQEQPEFCFRSPEMINLLQRVRKVASQDLSILISGETGVGKTRLARLIHDLSPRRDNIFLTVNCAALSENLLESEFFGHCKGAFTGAGAERIGKFAAAGSGTLLLDEIDALPLSAQPKLLRAIDERLFEPVGSNQTQKLHARLIVATNRNLTNEVAAGRFRTDLYYRLKVIEFELPPLRRRRQIIPVIAEAQLRECAARNQRTPPRLTPAALQALTLYDWPGNIRELRNVIECALAFADEEIQLENLPEAVRNGAAPAHSPALTVLSKMESAAQPERPPTRDELPAEVHDDSGDFAFGPQLSSLAQARALGEIGRIRRVLETSGNNRSLAARVLGISRAALYKRLRKFGLLDPDPLNGIDDTNP
jgi:transcriptional regulator with GAF, ATPase, and Fis domain